ncbi:hypothetical protein [Spiroplasma poulsonii]|uniref:Uncharacterized protein n=1 Tax=Spiroplasma poulsonii TaxID=2138 RepID=A0A2P6F9Q3_9MOLU|nr:hypothetical protein [Spiroplasma poulsonii]PQM29830.1 hypothetical protein SMSRO_SF027130 [Spiroplasma poulsonii]PQM30044.1 hypothetical protein SMSRO_SF027010 [Spiroplasma poulsonii]PQM30181.1 hypothetical protein SMSRO_SF024600 [Spiroplasma poulsonii]
MPQKDNVNFESTKTLYTENIKVNDTETIYVTAYTNGLSSGNYQSEYTISWRNWDINFLLQITKLSDNDNNKITETYLQAYYTNDMKLKIRFSKVLLAKLLGYCLTNNTSLGNDKDITIDVNALGVLNMINNSNNPVKITFTPR